MSVEDIILLTKRMTKLENTVRFQGLQIAELKKADSSSAEAPVTVPTGTTKAGATKKGDDSETKSQDDKGAGGSPPEVAKTSGD